VSKLNYKSGEHLFVIGKTGSGKSYLTEKFIKKEIKTNFVVFNIKVSGYESLGCHKVTNYNELVQALKTGKKKIHFQNKFLNNEILDKCLTFLYMAVKKNITVIVDELHFFTSKTKLLYGMGMFLKVGREEKKGFVGISQRAQDIHNTILSQSTHKLCGYVSEEDRDYMSTKLDLKKQNYTFNDLKQYEFFYLKDEAGVLPQIIKV
jgi:DNA helicase HerA-like ATPase